MNLQKQIQQNPKEPLPVVVFTCEVINAQRHNLFGTNV